MSPELDRFLAAARDARPAIDWPERVAEAMRRLLADAGPGLADELGADIAASDQKGIAVYAQGPDLTVYAVSGQGGLRSAPHDHATTAVVGLIEGSEGYKVYRREGHRAVETGRVRVAAGQVAVMPQETIHAMWCEPGEAGLSLHVYGNSHFDVAERRQWDPATLTEEPFEVGRQRAWIRELTRAARSAPTA
jgi:predicted metal-dependent enzyme (double-stranded beta helix superfamily)